MYSYPVQRGWRRIRQVLLYAVLMITFLTRYQIAHTCNSFECIRMNYTYNSVQYICNPVTGQHPGFYRTQSIFSVYMYIIAFNCNVKSKRKIHSYLYLRYWFLMQTELQITKQKLPKIHFFFKFLKVLKIVFFGCHSFQNSSITSTR